MMLGAGVAIGYAWGRSSVPEPEPQPPVQAETTLPAGVVEAVPTDTSDADLAAEEDLASQEATTTDEEPPPTPEQKSPKDGARIDAARVNLRWSEVEDDSGEPVTYAFEIQDKLSERQVRQDAGHLGAQGHHLLGASALRDEALAGMGARRCREQERQERLALLQAHAEATRAQAQAQAQRRDDVEVRELTPASHGIRGGVCRDFLKDMSPAERSHQCECLYAPSCSYSSS